MALSDEHPIEQVVSAFIHKIINASDETAFESSLVSLLQSDWESIKGTVLGGTTVMPHDGNTVLHEAAMKTNGGLDSVKIILGHAPFLMGKTNLSGETVWHIAAREEYHTGGLFDALVYTRLFLKKIFQASTDTYVCVNGVAGRLADLSVGAANNNGNTALHEAVVSNNMIVARVLVGAEAEENMESALTTQELPLLDGDFRFFNTPARFSARNIPPEERVVAAVQNAINAGNATAFRSSIEKAFRTDWDVLDIGLVLHSITFPGGRTVLHIAAITAGALKIVKTICDRAPFLMCKQDEYGETVWHIAARDGYVSKGLFDTLYDTRQLWKKRLEAADTPTLSVYGVDGGLDELSINVANPDGNTALHEALLCKNTPVAQKLFEADKDVCYKLNMENKSPMNLALENGEADAALFKSMYEYAAGTALGKSAIDSLSCIAFK